MSCALGMIRWIIFLVNFIFALGGLALFGTGLYLHFNIGEVDLPAIDAFKYPTIFLIIIGGIVFLIAFFGCCGAVQESHCMIVTFAMMLLALLVAQVVVAGYGWYKLKDKDLNEKLNVKLQGLIERYPSQAVEKSTVDALQIFVGCCGYNDYSDYRNKGSIPYSCCGKTEQSSCTETEAYQQGCKDHVFEKIEMYGKGLGLVALIIAAVELVGVIFAFCLANSIRNAERRGYKV